MRARLALGLAALALAAAGCGGRPAVKPSDEARRLELRCEPASPADLRPGDVVRVAAVPVPFAEMAWVSGTVKLFGAPVLKFRKDAKDSVYKFRTQVPPMVEIPEGTYEIKAWGITAAGERLEGRLDYEVSRESAKEKR